ncbi:hypothetical protein [Streptomyces lavendulae]|uniref:WDGH domain-containing protein n=1 Tax=Streptomyces lavendulae TaxID=1914 RepID=UPI0033ED3B56
MADHDLCTSSLDAAYRERAHLVAHLASLYPSQIAYADPEAPDWAVVTVEAPTGQMSWHVAPRDMDLFEHVERQNGLVLPWDGHSTEEKYERLRQLTIRPKRGL